MTKTNLTEKYRPHTFGDIVGNTKIKAELKAWAQTWKRIAPAWKGFNSLDKNNELIRGERGFRPAMVMEGPPGVGKTTCAHALAADMGWDVIELNASDARNRTRIREVVTRGALNQVLSFDDDGSFKSYQDGTMTLIILDEADNLYDRGAGKIDPGANNGFAAVEFVLELGHGCYPPARVLMGYSLLSD